MASRPKKIREVSGGYSPRISSRVLYFGDGLREESILSSSGNTPQTNAPPPGLFCCLRLTQLCSHPGHAGRELGSMCAISDITPGIAADRPDLRRRLNMHSNER